MCYSVKFKYAGMAELADALDSGSSRGNSVQVQVLSLGPVESLDTLFRVLRFFFIVTISRLRLVTNTISIFGLHKRKKPTETVGFLSCVGIALSSRGVTTKVFSALMSLTSVFGMGTGVPSSPKTPTYQRAL